MKNKGTKKLIVMIAVLFALFAVQSAVAQTVGLKEGMIAPDFSVKTLDGKEVKLSSFRGKPVFVNFWATWCGYCVKEMPDMQKMVQTYGDKIVILAVNVQENPLQVNRFIAKNKYQFTYVLDQAGTVAQNYNIKGFPTTMILDKNGLITKVHVGAMNEKQMIAGIENAF